METTPQHFLADIEEEHTWSILRDGERLDNVYGSWVTAKDYAQRHWGYPEKGVVLRHDHENCHGCPWEGR